MSDGDSETTIGALGLACALALALSACAVLPAAGRVAGEGVVFVAAWLALAGSAAFVLGPVLFLAGRLAALAFSGVRPALLGACWAVFPLSLFAGVLKVETNHRPLGAATYSVLALLVLIAAVFVAARVEDAAERDRDGLGVKLRFGGLALAILGAGIAAFQVLRNPDLRAGALDGLSFAAALALGVFVSAKVRPRSTFRHAVPLWVLVVVSGLVATSVHIDAITRAAPVLGGPVVWL